MGGHGGLNILPQKRWNVYNFDNREKVRRDEEEAAKEEQLKREQSRKRDAEFRLERLRTAKGLQPLIQPRESEPDSDSKPESEPEHGDSGHINLFEGIKIFDPIRVPKRKGDDEREEIKKNKKMLKKEGGDSIRVVGPEDEKYRLGYGVAGKGVQLPWYVQKKKPSEVDDDDDDDFVDGGRKGEKKKKTLEELREERLKREKREKEREKALKQQKQQRHGDVCGSGRFSRR